MNFEQAFQRLLGHEGEFQSDPEDRANWTSGVKGVGLLKGTKYGISAMSYPHEDIKNMTVERARQTYLRDFWVPAGCDLVPQPIKYVLFDTAVHTSMPGRPKAAVKMLQRAAGVTDDGVIGKQTILAINSIDPYRLFARFVGQRIDYSNNNREQWQRYGAGWSQRFAEILMEV